MNEEKLLSFEAEYATAKTERAKAEIELRAWNELGREARAEKVIRSVFIQETFGAVKYDVEMRLQLLGMGDWTDELWARIDDVMPVKTAVDLARKARSRALNAGSGESFKEAIRQVLSQYDALPQVKSVGNGRFIRKANYHKLIGDVPKKVEKKPEKKSEKKKKTASDGDSEQSFRSAIRAAIRKYIQEKLPLNVSELAVQNEVQRFETDLRVLLEQLTARMYDLGREESAARIFSRKRFSAACQVLRVAPPRDNDIGPSFLKKAKHLFKELARQYHTDVSGTEATRDQFDAVMEAWRIVENYAEMTLSNRKSKEHGKQEKNEERNP